MATGSKYDRSKNLGNYLHPSAKSRSKPSSTPSGSKDIRKSADMQLNTLESKKREMKSPRGKKSTLPPEGGVRG